MLACRRADAPIVCLCVVAACGGPPAAPQVPASAERAVTAPPSPPPTDLSPVAPPASLVVSGRLVKPSASLATVHGWSGLPMPQSEHVTEMLTGESIGALVDLDRPIDFAVGLVGPGVKRRVLGAVSAAVRDPGAARAALADRFKLVPGDNGALLIQTPRSSSRHDEEDDARTCELAPAYGAAPMRIVCAWEPKALSELGPWLTRSATRAAAVGGDLHLDARMEPLRSALSEPNVKQTLSAALAAIAAGSFGAMGTWDLAISLGSDLADFVLDVDAASLDVALSDAVASAEATLRFSSTASALGRLLTAHPERVGPPPAPFLQMPADADFAFFHPGIDPSNLARGEQVVLNALGDRLAEDGVKEVDRKAVVDALGKLASPAGLAYASGMDADLVRRALAAEQVGGGGEFHDRGEAGRAAAEGLLGWRLLERDEAPDPILGAAKELVAVMGRPSVVAAYRAKAKDRSPPSVRSAPPPKGLPKGTAHYVLELGSALGQSASGSTSGPASKPASAASTKPLTVHFLIGSDGAHTWVAVSGDEALGAAKLAAALSSGGDKLASRSDLSSLRDASVGAGGFVTSRGLSQSGDAIAVLFGRTPRHAAEGLEDSAQLPHHAATPMVFGLTARSGVPDAAALSLLATFRVPRAAIDDALASVARHGGF